MIPASTLPSCVRITPSRFVLAVVCICVSMAQMPRVRANDDKPAELPWGALTRVGLYQKDSGYIGVYRAAFTADGKLLATRSNDQIVRIWSIESGEKICEIDGHDGRVTDVAFAPDARHIITCSPGEREAILMWDTRTGKLARRFPGGARAVNFDKTGGVIFYVDDKKYGSLNVSNGERFGVASWQHSPSDTLVALSHDGQSLATYNHADRRRRLFRISLWQQRPKSSRIRIVLGGLAADPLFPGEISVDGQHFVVACRGKNEAQLWDIRQPKTNQLLKGHTQPVQAVAFSHDGRLIATASWDATVRIWEVMSATTVATLQGHRERVCAVAFAPDDRRLASGASGRSDNSTVVWDVRRVLFNDKKTVAAAEEPDEQVLADLWKQLAALDPKQGYTAIGRLLASPEQAIDLFENKVKAVVQEVDQANIEQLIRDLDDNRFDVRERAHKELVRLRAPADALLRVALQDAPSAEVHYRVTRILATPASEVPIATEQLFQLRRMIFTLELIGNDAAREQLSVLSTGHPHAVVMRDAAASLRRLAHPDGF